MYVVIDLSGSSSEGKNAIEQTCKLEAGLYVFPIESLLPSSSYFYS